MNTSLISVAGKVSICLALAMCLPSDSRAAVTPIPVPASGYTNDFSAAPALADGWAQANVLGANTTVRFATDLDANIMTNIAVTSAIAGALTTDVTVTNST